MNALSARFQSFSEDHASIVRFAALFVIVLLGVYAVLATIAIVENWYFLDARGYWDTGLSLRNGGELYPPLVDQEGPRVYRYAPWFAWLWMLLSYLPQDLVFVAWGLALAAASAWVIQQLPRNLTGVALALIFAPVLFRVISQGNVQPLMVAALTWGLLRWSGPGWVAAAASLKLVPILFAAVYIARREYLRALTSLVLTALLWLPALAHGVEDYPALVVGQSLPLGWITVVLAAAALLLLFLTPARYRALAAAVAVTFANPRWIPYNPSYLVVGSLDPPLSSEETDEPAPNPT